MINLNQNFYNLLQKNNFQSKKNTQRKVAFRGCLLTEKNNIEGIHSLLKHETSFFRGMPTLEFVKKYIQKKFNKKETVNILDGACSTGEETWTLAMLLRKFKNIKLTGFDLGYNVIRKANKGVYPISQRKTFVISNGSLVETWADFCDAYRDSFLEFTDKKNLSKAQKKYLGLFNSFFKKIPNYKDSRRFHDPNEITKYFKIRPQKKSLCTFIQKNVMDLDTFAKDDDIDVFLFRNALYHFITTDKTQGLSHELKPHEQIIKFFDSFFQMIHKKLSKDGIFVLGSDEILQSNGNYWAQKSLERNGFKPIFQEFEDFISVWKKINFTKA